MVSLSWDWFNLYVRSFDDGDGSGDCGSTCRSLPTSNSQRLQQVSTGSESITNFYKIFKNLIGVGLLVAGLAMLVLPGQGLLTILIGIYLLDFPGKIKIINKMLKNQNLRRTLNWIRQKFKRPLFVFDEEKS